LRVETLDDRPGGRPLTGIAALTGRRRTDPARKTSPMAQFQGVNRHPAPTPRFNTTKHKTGKMADFPTKLAGTGETTPRIPAKTSFKLGKTAGRSIAKGRSGCGFESGLGHFATFPSFHPFHPINEIPNTFHLCGLGLGRCVFQTERIWAPAGGAWNGCRRPKRGPLSGHTWRNRKRVHRKSGGFLQETSVS